MSREVAALLRRVRATDPDAVVAERGPGELSGTDLDELTTASLFGGLRMLIVRGAADLAEAERERLARVAGDLPEHAVLVVVHAGGVKGRSLVQALQAAGADVRSCAGPTRPAERLEFVAEEVRRIGGTVTAGACRALVEAVGTDLWELATVSAQIVADTDGPVDEAAVARYRRGRAETRGYEVADAAMSGDLPGALALLESALTTGTAPVLVTAALAAGLRDLARVGGAGRGPVAEIAKALGMPPWRVQRCQRVLRGWSPEAVASVLPAVARADAGVKGAAGSPRAVLQDAVLAVCTARTAGPGPR